MILSRPLCRDQTEGVEFAVCGMRNSPLENRRYAMDVEFVVVCC